ncbi:hypothetical protein DN069_27860 [Streptacidiphilus pinicola]|uniref:Uncharacterized protein n=1 Tax=Streptacidiphilus pinicola TaxID=2219663 RepID=A0A2X0K512_9ACTN|nr:hypothetical protein [Streptacidiphilus pinicola]RAG82380.1 hypothetical protein DN069_27860 [Streptacidiphilus pinicola]
MPKIDDQPDDPFDKLVLDEDFVRAAEHKEGSARARMLASRWKKSPPQDTSWRAPVIPLKPRRRRRRQLPLFVLLAVGLVAVSMNAKKVHDWAFSKAPGVKAGAAHGAVAPALTTTPTAAPPTPMVDQSPDLQHPFVGSPADTWSSGAAGIALPPAKPIGVFSASTVAKDEQLVKDYLVAAYLDPRTIAGGYPQGALDLLAPANSAWMRKLVDHPAPKADDAIMLTSRFDPTVAVPVGDVRVQGEVSLADDGDNGLRIRSDFDFVYASHPVGSTEVERTIARRTLTFRFYDPNRYQGLPAGTVWIEHYDGYTGDQLCGFTRGYLVPYFHAPAASDSASAAPSGTAVDPYDLSKAPDLRAACAVDSRE